MKTQLFRTIVLTAVLLGFASSTQADVLVYNLSLTNRVMGGGANSLVRASGRLLHDIDTGEKVMIYRYILRGAKRYEVHCENFTVSHVIVPGGTNTILSGVRSLVSEIDPNTTIGLRMFYARGANMPTELRRFRIESVARALRGFSREIVNADDGNTYAVETSVDATLNLAATRSVNTRGTGLQELVFNQRQAWEDADFTLAVDDCNP
jgi:hypothetical protein